MTKANKILIIRISIAVIFWLTALILEHVLPDELKYEIIYLVLYVISYLTVGYDVILNAIKKIPSGQFLDEDFLMFIASVGAFLLRIFGPKEYMEATAVMIFFQVGEVFEGIAVERSKNAILDTINLKVNKCYKRNGEEINPEDLKVNDEIMVKPGEMVAVDGYALNDGIINTASLTGEALDVLVNKDDVVLSGSVNKNTPLYLKVKNEYFNSTATKILDMVENATMRKAKSEKFINKFAKVYTPIVVGIAFVIAVIVPLIIGLATEFTSELWSSYIYVAITCLVVSCPCALVVSVPLTYFAGIGANAKHKIIVKGGVTLDDLANANTVILDKTGTLTKASFEITKVYGDETEVLKIASGLETSSTHPLALAINKKNIAHDEYEIEEVPGYGMVGYKDNIRYICASGKYLDKLSITYPKYNDAGNTLYITKDDKYIGAIVLEDEIKMEAKEAIDMLKADNTNIYVLSGDSDANVKSATSKLGINNYYASLLPQDKVSKAEEIIKDTTGKTVFVGDGINDAPVLALADIGVSMGQIGSDAAVEASDVVVLNDNLNALPLMIRIAKKTKRIVVENIWFSIGVKIIILFLAILFNMPFMEGLKLPMWVAIFGDVGVLIIAVFNAIRALFIKNKKQGR